MQFAYIGGAFLLIGTAGAAVVTVYMEMKKSKRYDLGLKILLTIGFFGMVMRAIAFL